MRWLLDVVQTLEKVGLYRTASRLLDAHPSEYGQSANSLRRRLRRNAPSYETPAGVYLLATTPDRNVGCVVPVRAERGKGETASRDVHGGMDVEICRRAQEAAKQVFSSPQSLPELGLILPPNLCIDGPSAGLPLSLAFAAKWHGRGPHVPVLATGEIDEQGRILPVECLEEKLEAALAELGGSPGMVLFPSSQAPKVDARSPDTFRPVSTLEDAVREVWREQPPIAVDRALLSLETTLEEARRQIDPRRALQILESHPRQGLAPADRARLLFAQGICCRHVGASEKAARIHEEARQLFPGNEGAIGAQTLETFEIEYFATAMDLFAFDGLESDLRVRLEKPFLATHNMVRCNGVLAQLLSTLGRHEEAVRLRWSNLELQTASEAMCQEIPRTLACLAYESARGGMQEQFEAAVHALFEKTMPGDTHQARYNLCAVARGLVLLDRHAELLEWGQGGRELFGRPADGALRDLLGDREGAPVERHPEVSTVRAIVRALRRAGEFEKAARIACRVQHCESGQGDLVQWLAALVEVERALALSDAGEKDLAVSVLASAARKLRACHAHAARFHAALVAAVEKPRLDRDYVKSIEMELDRVYY
jgi:tetratricopeptide (TPR) repeat protein